MSTAPLQPDLVVEQPAFVIRYATTDDDVIAVHQLYLVLGNPIAQMLSGKDIDALKSLHELLRLAANEVIIMLVVDGHLVGILGLMRGTWYFNDVDFMTDRFHFVLPEFAHSEAATALMDEAKKIASFAGLKFIHQGKVRDGKRGVIQMMPRMFAPEPDNSPSQEVH